MAIALIAEYGDCWPGAISLIGRSCTTRCPASASQAVSASRSPMSPMPQLVVRGHENSGIRMPDRRPRRLSVMHASRRLEMTQDAIESFGEDIWRRQQADDEVRLSREVEEEPGMRENAGPGHKIDGQLL